jgi:hypothetical protein
MFKALLAGAALAITAAAAASAQPETAARTMVCVDVNGALLAADCRAQPSRLEAREDICLCPRGNRVEASVCPPGVPPPAESLPIARARRLILRDRGSLVGANFEGQPLCVAPRQR